MVGLERRDLLKLALSEHTVQVKGMKMAANEELGAKRLAPCPGGHEDAKPVLRESSATSCAKASLSHCTMHCTNSDYEAGFATLPEMQDMASAHRVSIHCCMPSEQGSPAVFIRRRFMGFTKL